ncbi:MAG: ATP-dependent helicase HrpA, partial [Caballeronia sp.]|nr:ATP-dependent helicase HrpA [Caballeronia sp.]
MPNVSKRPADADKLDPQDQLKKLREALLRDAAARDGDGENEGEESADNAVNRKKEAAARRFAGVSGTAARGAASGSAAGSVAGQQASKKSAQKGA